MLWLQGILEALYSFPSSFLSFQQDGFIFVTFPSADLVFVFIARSFTMEQKTFLFIYHCVLKE